MWVNLYSEVLEDMVCTLITSMAGAALFGTVAVIGMIILLVTAELTDTSGGLNLKIFSRHLTVAVVPLLIVSIFIAIMELLVVIS